MTKVVTCLLINDEGKILILRRSSKVKTYKELWGGIAGYVEENEDPYGTAVKEIKEEAGISKEELKLIRKGKTIEFTDLYNNKKYDWMIFPFLFFVKKSKIQIDWEHTEYRWISPSDITRYKTVPHLKDIILNFFGKNVRMGKRWRW